MITRSCSNGNHELCASLGAQVFGRSYPDPLAPPIGTCACDCHKPAAICSCAIVESQEDGKAPEVHIEYCLTHAAAQELARVLNRLVHLDARLRLRNPATEAEKGVWQQVRREARTALASAGVAGRPDEAAPQRPIPPTLQIASWLHCALCLDELPEGVSPKEWSRTQTGTTPLGIQVWCNLHEANVVHIDFQGLVHPANMDRQPEPPAAGVLPGSSPHTLEVGPDECGACSALRRFASMVPGDVDYATDHAAAQAAAKRAGGRDG